MKVWIDQDLCTGDGLCEEIAPDVLRFLMMAWLMSKRVRQSMQLPRATLRVLLVSQTSLMPNSMQ